MEKRLIDANAYAEDLWKLRENYQMWDDTHTADKIMHGIFRAEQALKEQPTFDAVPVVRCGECVYYSDEYGSCGRTDIIRSDMRLIMPYWYCADGERKEQDDATN